jgi:release factor glutamine methyltransferase
VALAKYLPQALVYATDTSESVLKIAKRNSRKHGVAKKISFRKGSLFNGLKGLKFDLIVSNPPYIPTPEIKRLQPEVKNYEPRKALDGGKDGLSLLRKIIAQAPPYLAKGGKLALEVGFGQAKAVRKLALKSGFKNIEMIKDLTGIERIVIIKALA